MSSVRPDIGSRIREARNAAGLTQVQLAECTGQAERTVQAWEANTRTPRMAGLLAIAAATGRDVAWFYTDHETRGAAA